jgi:hypothetical protein
VGIIVLTTGNNSSVISWWSFLLTDEPAETHRPVVLKCYIWVTVTIFMILVFWDEHIFKIYKKSCCGRDRLVVWFTTTYEISGGHFYWRMNPQKPSTYHKWLTNTYCCIEWTSTRVGFELTTLVVMGADFIGSCKSNYQTITATITVHLSSCLLTTGTQLYY